MFQTKEVEVNEWMPDGDPVKAMWKPDRRTSRLWWDDANGEFDVRGGICWPRADGVGHNQRVVGFACLFGLDVDTGRVYSFSEKWFVCVDHILADDGSIEYEGLAPWFNMCWAKYHARNWYYADAAETHRRYHLQVLRSKQIDPKPVFIEVDWPNDVQAERAYLELVNLDRFIGVEGSVLHDERRQRQVRPDLPLSVPLRAWYAGFSGLLAYPWRARKKAEGLSFFEV